MSKSKGNVVDPLIMINRYGTDAFRFTLLSLTAMGRDVKLAEDRIAGYQNFVNKLWNASRFVLLNLDDAVVDEGRRNIESLEDEDLEALRRLHSTYELDFPNISVRDEGGKVVWADTADPDLPAYGSRIVSSVLPVELSIYEQRTGRRLGQGRRTPYSDEPARPPPRRRADRSGLAPAAEHRPHHGRRSRLG